MVNKKLGEYIDFKKYEVTSEYYQSVIVPMYLKLREIKSLTEVEDATCEEDNGE